MAWLHAKPKGSDKSRIEQFRSKDENHPLLKLPDIQEEYAAGYIIGLLHESGLMSNNGMGPSPISWVEIQAWLSVTGLELSTWEKLLLKELSEEYVTELSLATDLKRQAPYMTADDSLDRNEVQDKILNVFRAFKRLPNENVEE